ncbi:MAG: 4-hydroxybenzoate 3-monooxygenase [Gammaproteobacteria bacterium]|nr:4-hydroxybenzoate 3-monooxygenase [Gammaproteobacteria bacterium]
MKTQVGIIGGGPSGLLLSQLLYVNGIDSVVLEKHSKQHVLSRIRAGLLEQGTTQMLDEAGVAAGLSKNGLEHEGVDLVFEGRSCRVDFFGLTGKKMTIYGQTEVTRDLYEAREKSAGCVLHEVSDISLSALDTEKPEIGFYHHDQAKSLQCDFVVGCDGYHGVSRMAMPEAIKREYQSSFPLGWLGVLSETPPVSPELVYAYHQRGFALCSMRSTTRSRYYIQVPLDEQIDDWSDDRFWEELKKRLPPGLARELITGPSIEKSIAPLRSFVCEPMRWKSLFLAGDAAHIVPTTGAKGLNLAVSDVRYLSRALSKYYQSRDSRGLDNYSRQALARVWKSSRFSWSLTQLLHQPYDRDSAFSSRIRRAEFEYLLTSEVARLSFAENYVGLPY